MGDHVHCKECGSVIYTGVCAMDLYDSYRNRLMNAERSIGVCAYCIVSKGIKCYKRKCKIKPTITPTKGKLCS